MSAATPASPQAPVDLQANRFTIVGFCLEFFGYGISFTLFIQCFRALRPHFRRNRLSTVLMGYIWIMFILSSFASALQIKGLEIAATTFWGYGGGIHDALIPLSITWELRASQVMYIVSSWFQDALLLYRFWVIYNANYLAVALPTLMLMATIIVSCFFMDAFLQPETGFWARKSINIGIPYTSITMAFNVLVTVMIVLRLAIMRARIRKVLGPAAATPYISVIAMLVESAFMYSALGIVVSVTYGMGSVIESLFLNLFGQMTSIAPFMIILRVANGHAYSKETAAAVTASMQFASTTSGAPFDSTDASSRRSGVPVTLGDPSRVGLRAIGLCSEEELPREGG
ncbi:hypothetical protein A0H81_13075 [Grifola frondosa]|uniref:Uncharacterized protein n=1 Tax=Grifola frondosa TaxID=5627 RepID=A0A1C7LPN7_GRIFR|nr:hypothetical protein A0H81_13075 [Grifola frondosa]